VAVALGAALDFVAGVASALRDASSSRWAASMTAGERGAKLVSRASAE
jgi:hypothetical protein